MVSLESTVPVAPGQFISNRARLSAKSSAIGCLVVVSGVVLQPERAANVIVDKMKSKRVVFMLTTIWMISVAVRSMGKMQMFGRIAHQGAQIAAHGPCRKQCRPNE
jgi:hypothetical protein